MPKCDGGGDTYFGGVRHYYPINFRCHAYYSALNFGAVERYMKICKSLRKKSNLEEANHALDDVCSLCPITPCKAIEYYNNNVAVEHRIIKP